MTSPPPLRVASTPSGAPGCQQATDRPRSSVTSCGSSVRHRAEASGQRAAYAHPGGWAPGPTGCPGIVASGSVQVGGHVRHGREERPGVGVLRTAGVGALGVDQVGDGELLDDPAGVHDDDAVADLPHDGDVVADEEQRRVLLALHLLEEGQDLRLDGDVERRGRLVRDDQPRGAHQAHADHGPLAHAAGELERVLPRPALGVADAHGVEPVHRAGERALAVQPLVVAGDLGQLGADPHGGVEGGHRVLEDHRQRGAQQLVVPGRRSSSRRAGRPRRRRAGRRPPARAPR